VYFISKTQVLEHINSREQWVGVEGAPSTFVITFDGVPRDRKIGLGGSLVYDRIGPVIQTGMYFNYAYHVKVDELKTLSLGLMGGANYYQFDLMSLRVAEPDDDIPVEGVDTKLLPNFGFGAFFYTPDYFLGFSMPKMIRNHYINSQDAYNDDNREERHFFIWAGLLFDLNGRLRFKPSLIGRIVNGAPVSLDVNATFVLDDRIWLGAIYRLGVNWGGLVKWQLNKELNVGYSYDFGSTRLSGYGTATHEIYISIDLIIEMFVFFHLVIFKIIIF
jgi:type IX secretion system PorP/SprF family membrane protein